MLDPKRPIIDNYNNREFKVIYSDGLMAMGYIINGSKLYHAGDQEHEHPQPNILLLNLATGLVRSRWPNDSDAMSLTFRQGPFTYGDSLTSSGDSVNVTVEDGKIVRIDVV